MEKERLIAYIMEHDPNADRIKLEAMPIEHLVILKVQLELDAAKEDSNE